VIAADQFVTRSSVWGQIDSRSIAQRESAAVEKARELGAVDAFSSTAVSSARAVAMMNPAWATPSYTVARNPIAETVDAACSATPRRRGTTRVALSPASFTRLQRLALKRYGATASRLGCVVLDEYLATQERFYCGAERIHTTMVTQAESRAMDAVIFDMDGVLCDSEMASRNAAVAVLEELYGLKGVRPDDFAAFTGMGEGRFLGGVAEMRGVTNFDEQKAKARFFELYLMGGYIRDVRAYPGVRSLVLRLKETGLKVAVASAADKVKVEANLLAIGLSDEGLFDFVTSSDDIVHKKPAPDVFLAAAKGLSIDPARCVVVEDAVAGVTAAKRAGMRCVAVATSLASEALVDAGADLVRDAPAFISLEDLFGAPLVPAGQGLQEPIDTSPVGPQ
jgi:HAD superfamily hydrolase (TIGR01509 family)